MRKKKCKNCKTVFQPVRPLQQACKPRCAIELIRKKQEKMYRKETRERKKKLKSKSDWLKEAQTVCNKYIRMRDKGKPCISCGKEDNGQHQRHASHFKSMGNCSPLRFHEMNIHASCMRCNSYLSGNLLKYKNSLIKKHGKEIVGWMEAQTQTYSWDIEDIKEVKKYYKQKITVMDNEI
ncbi:MAG: recombination protein NinG [Deltaproteobacteria bacterium]|nr:recombination protein NinG [Deltaproteobacteria bacterium]